MYAPNFVGTVTPCIRRRVHRGHKRMESQQQVWLNARLKYCSNGTKGPKVYQVPPHPLHHQYQQPEPLIQDRMDSSFHVVNDKF